MAWTTDPYVLASVGFIAFGAGIALGRFRKRVGAWLDWMDAMHPPKLALMPPSRRQTACVMSLEAFDLALVASILWFAARLG